jgi:hypothetical protein
MRYLSVALLLCSHVLAQSTAITLSIATAQTGPVQILSATSSQKYLMDKIKIRNRSGKEVSLVTFGISLNHGALEARPDSALPLLGKDRPIRAETDETVTIDSAGILGADVVELARRSSFQRPTATLGVVRVEFADGSRWTYDLVGSKVFPKESVVELAQNAAGRAELLAAACNPDTAKLVLVQSGGGQGYFTYVGVVGSCIYCTNNVSSCTASTCTIQQGTCLTCAKQTCEYRAPTG